MMHGIVVPSPSRESAKEVEMPEINLSIVTEHGGHRALLSVNGTELETPPIEHLVYYAGIGVLVAAEIIEFPVAALLAVGHVLIGLTRRPGLEALGEALQEV